MNTTNFYSYKGFLRSTFGSHSSRCAFIDFNNFAKFFLDVFREERPPMALRIDNVLRHRELHVHVLVDREVARDTPQPAVEAARILVGGSLTADPVVGVEELAMHYKTVKQKYTHSTKLLLLMARGLLLQ